MNETGETTSSKKPRLKPSIWRRLFAWGPMAATILLWFHSLVFFAGVHYEYDDGANPVDWQVNSHAGTFSIQHIAFEYNHGDQIEPTSQTIWIHQARPLEGGLRSAFGNFDWINETDTYSHYSVRGVFLAIPYWWFFTLTTLWLAFLVWCRKRRGATDCIKCGYDLRGSNGACPECGTVPKSQKASS